MGEPSSIVSLPPYIIEKISFSLLYLTNRGRFTRVGKSRTFYQIKMIKYLSLMKDFFKLCKVKVFPQKELFTEQNLYNVKLALSTLSINTFVLLFLVPIFLD